MLWKIRIFQRRTYIDSVGLAAERAPATSLYGDVTDAGVPSSVTISDVEFGAGESGEVGRSHDKTCRDNRRIN